MTADPREAWQIRGYVSVPYSAAATAHDVPIEYLILAPDLASALRAFHDVDDRPTRITGAARIQHPIFVAGDNS